MGIPVRTRIVKIKIKIQKGEEKRAIEMRVLIKTKLAFSFKACHPKPPNHK